MKKLYLSLAAVLAALALYFVVIPAFMGRLLLQPTVEYGPLVIRWYGLILGLAILAGYLICRKYAWRFGISQKEVDNYSFWLVLVSFIGARLYTVGFAYEYFLTNPQEIYKVWHGGLSIFGAIIFGLAFTLLWCIKKPYSAKQLIDLIALGLPIGQAIGRWGNFVNQEAFGLPTDLPWKMFVVESNRPPGFESFSYFHPTFLYESILLVGVYFVVRYLLGRVKPGVLGFVYLALYSIIRFFIEPIRLDSVWLGLIRADQLVAFILVLISCIFIIKWQIAHKNSDTGQTVEN